MPLDSYHHISRDPAPGQPLVIALHGTGGDEHQFAGLVEQILPGAGLVSPRGDVSEHGAARFFRRSGEGIYDMADLSQATDKMTAFIRAHRAAHPGAPLYALGYSNGANILASVLLQTPELLDRTVFMHPLIPWFLAPLNGAGRRRAGIFLPAAPHGHRHAA